MEVLWWVLAFLALGGLFAYIAYRVTHQPERTPDEYILRPDDEVEEPTPEESTAEAPTPVEASETPSYYRVPNLKSYNRPRLASNDIATASRVKKPVAQEDVVSQPHDADDGVDIVTPLIVYEVLSTPSFTPSASEHSNSSYSCAPPDSGPSSSSSTDSGSPSCDTSSSSSFDSGSSSSFGC
jgi:hypothetical protein